METLINLTFLVDEAAFVYVGGYLVSVLVWNRDAGRRPAHGRLRCAAVAGRVRIRAVCA